MKDTMSVRLFSLVICICCCAIVVLATCARVREDDSLVSSDDSRVAKKYCSSCHLFPEPVLLDKNTWKDQSLPAMGHRFGIYSDRSRSSLIESGPAKTIVERANVFPSMQTISDADWESITQYYVDHAPDRLTSSSDTVSIRYGHTFQSQEPAFSIPRPAVSALTFDEKNMQLFVADCSLEKHSSITILDAALKPVAALGLPHPVSNLSLRNDTLFILLMGHFVPSDEPAGQLLRAIRNANGGYEGYQRVISNLKRPVDVAYGDLDGDDNDEIVICEFGNHTGSVSLFMKNGNRAYNKTILLEAPGATSVTLEDLNNDNKKDIVVLMAQGDEGIDVYFNRGEGKFERRRILRFPPVYGSVSLVVADINNDGWKDIVYVNGDNADASRVLKPYHGVRVFVNEQGKNFVEKYFFSLHGAYDAIVHDFDKDGDLDIAAISFFGDLNRSLERGFVYLDNVSVNDSLAFSGEIIKDTGRGRWISMTGGDLNKDGYQDIILGSFTSMLISGDSMNVVRTQLAEQALPILILKNQGKQ